jgi:hypothetical protein
MGKTACQENADGCRTCGRGTEEIYGTRALVDELAKFAQRMGYQNPDVFFQYVADKAEKKLAHMQQQQPQVIKRKAVL